MAKLPDPVIEKIGNIFVLRDDLIPGGTKRRVIDRVLIGGGEFVYASPAYGYAQIALAHACREAGKQATIFTAKRRQLHPRTMEAKAAGAKIVLIETGYLSNVQAKARDYAAAAGAVLLPFGLDLPEFVIALAGIAKALPINPPEVWTVAGSGVLSRALQLAWPAAGFYAIQIGKTPNVGRAVKLTAPEKFENDAKIKPPFPSCGNYDAKAWRFIQCNAKPGALFWNVAA